MAEYLLTTRSDMSSEELRQVIDAYLGPRGQVTGRGELAPEGGPDETNSDMQVMSFELVPKSWLDEDDEGFSARVSTGTRE